MGSVKNTKSKTTYKNTSIYKNLEMENFYAQTVFAKSFTKKLGDNEAVKSRCSTCDSMASQASFRSNQSSVTKTQLVKRLLAKEERAASFEKQATKSRTETMNSIYSMEHVFWV